MGVHGAGCYSQNRDCFKPWTPVAMIQGQETGIEKKINPYGTIASYLKVAEWNTTSPEMEFFNDKWKFQELYKVAEDVKNLSCLYKIRW